MLTLTLILVIVQVDVAAAVSRWYVGNARNNSYGVRADIRTPPSLPILYAPPAGESASAIASWVSTEGSPIAWVQAGWAMYHNWSGAYSYLECQPFGGTLIRTWFSSSGPQPWGYARSYEVVWAGGDDDRWRVNIAGQDRGI